MKWLFALLLVANAALFMWGQWYRAPLVDPAPAAPPRDVAPEKIKLLTEPGVRLLLRSRSEPAPPVPAPTAAARCFRLGPFERPETADSAGRTLQAQGFEYQRVAEADAQPAAYHVYLPPLPSRQAAERRRRELTALGFTDHALIQEDGLEHGISLGVFTVESNARARVAQLARRGVEARVRPIPGTRSVHWLTLAPAPEGIERLERLAGGDWGVPGVALRQAACAPAPAAPARPAG